MRKSIVLAAATAALLSIPVADAAPRGAPGARGHYGGHTHYSGYRHVNHGHSHVHGSVGFYFGAPAYYGWYPPYPYYYPPAYVVPAAPPVYIERADEYAAPAPVQSYWYYCPDTQAYYPYVGTCASPWQRVAPQPPQP